MSEHVETGRVPFFASGPAEASRTVERDRGNDWPLAVAFLGAVIVSYTVGIGAIYLALTALL
jgi:hypothetical protein